MSLKVIRTICILTALLTMLCYVNTVDAQDFVTDGLVAVYTLNDADIDGKVVKDIFGGNDAELFGSLKSVEGATDATGEALEFEGKADNYIGIPDLGDYEFVSIECYALEAQFGGIQGIVSTWHVGRLAKSTSNLRATRSKCIRTMVSRFVIGC